MRYVSARGGKAMQSRAAGATCMQQDTTPEPLDRHVFVDGRWLLRAAGGTNEFDDGAPAEGATAEAEPGASPEVAADSDQSPEPGYFDEGFDPESLPAEIRSRYEDMSRDYYGKTQSLAERRRSVEAFEQLSEAHGGFDGVNSAVEFFSAFQNPETRMQAFMELAEYLGYELPEDDEDADFEDYEEENGNGRQDPAEFRDPRLDELLYEAQLAEVEQQLNAALGELEKQRGLSLNETERAAVIQLAVNRPLHVNGEVDLDGAFNDYATAIEDRLKSYRESKKSPQPPVAGAPGVPDDTPLGNDKARRQRALEIANRSFASEV